MIQTVIAILWKAPCAGKDWGQEKGVTEDEMLGCHHWLQGHEVEQTPGDSEGQRSLECCSPWGHKESNMTEWLNKLQDIWLFLGTETQSADQKTWKATEGHFLEAHEFSTSSGGHKCTVSIHLDEKITNNNNYAHFLLFLHFKSEK